MKEFETLLNKLAGESPFVAYSHMPLVMTELCKAIMADKTFFISVNLTDEMKNRYGKNHITKADIATGENDVDFTLNTLKTPDGEGLLPAFTTVEQALKNGESDTFEVDVYQFFDMLVDNPTVDCAIINPFDKAVIVDKNMAGILLDQFE